MPASKIRILGTPKEGRRRRLSVAPKGDGGMASHRCGRSPAVCPGADTAALQPFQGRVSFEEVAVYFTDEEWGRLDPGQRRLYSEVMSENYKTVTWLESLLNAKPSLISWLEDGEKDPFLQSAAREDRIPGLLSSPGLHSWLWQDSPVFGVPTDKQQMKALGTFSPEKKIFHLKKKKELK